MAYGRGASGLARLKKKLQFRAKLLKLRPDKTYIFPTGFGFGFGILSFILLAMAIGYGNNILYFFVFLLVAMGLSTLWLTNKNIEALRIINLEIGRCFANEKNLCVARVENLTPKKTNLWDIEFIGDSESQLLNEVVGQAEVAIDWTPATRGYGQFPRIRIQSRFPFKLARAWKYYDEAAGFLVYPERKGELGLSALIGQQANREEATKTQNEGLFRDHRDFQNSDSPSRIDWKRSIRHQKHLVKNHENSGDRKLIIEWEMTKSSGGFESRISQLAQWVDTCHRQNELYSLRIKKFQTGFFASHGHYRVCMEKLALLGKDDV